MPHVSSLVYPRRFCFATSSVKFGMTHVALTYGIASLALKNTADQEWLSRRFTKMYDILRETRA